MRVDTDAPKDARHVTRLIGTGIAPVNARRARANLNQVSQNVSCSVPARSPVRRALAAAKRAIM